MKIDIVDFREKTFREIPKQDNPAFMTKKEWEVVGLNGCILITKESISRFSVFKITPVDNPMEEDSVRQLAFFWDIELAILFAEAYINKPFK